MGSGDGFADELHAIVSGYIGEVDRAVEDDVRAAAQVTVDQLRGVSDPGHTGKYAGGWTMEPDAEDMGANAYRIFNKRKPGLTHLLEHGHGGPAPAGAHPHIADAAEAGFAELKRRLNG